MKELLRFLKPYKKECIAGPIFKLLEAILELLLPTVMVVMINNGVMQKDSRLVIQWGLIMLVMAVIGFGSSCVCQFYAAKASQGYGTDLRHALFAHITTFSYAELDSFGTATLTTRLTNDINQLQLAVAMLIRLVIRAPFICIGAIIMAMLLNAKLSLILLGITPLFIIILYGIIRKTSPLYTQAQQKLDGLSTIVSENLLGVRVIRAFSKDSYEKTRFNQQTDDLTDTMNCIAKYSALLSPITSFIMNGAIVLILWAGAIQINVGTFTIGEIIAYINYVTQVLLALIVVSNLVILFTKAYTAGLRVAEVLHTKPSIISCLSPNQLNQETALTLSEHDVMIELKDVSFSYYSSADTTLEHISFKIHKGESFGIIGATGSGKTTLISLLGRFYDATDGEVIVNHRKVQDYSLKALRSLIGYVPQKSLLISGTISENLRLGNLLATDLELIEACKIAQIHDFIISLPDGYNTQVIRGGQNFSGGQKQRLAIARALVTNPQLLVLDDSSSALDFATEAAVRKELDGLIGTLTLLTISQRISSIKHCNRILVLDDGKISGIGTHDELLLNCSVYLELYHSQMNTEAYAYE